MGKKMIIDAVITPNSQRTTEGVSAAEYTDAELSMFEQLRRDFKDDIRQEMLDILVDHPRGLLFAQIKKRLKPPFNKIPVLRILLMLEREKHVTTWKSEKTKLTRYGLMVNDWITRAAKKEGVA